MRLLRGAAAVVAVAVLAVSAVGPAAGATTSDGLWYYDLGHIGDAHAAGINGDGVTIAVLDSPINTAVPTLANANIEVREPSYCFDENGAAAPAISADLDGPNSAFHGTNVASLIAGTGDGYPGQTGIKGVAPGAKLLYYAVSQFESKVAGGDDVSCRGADGKDQSDVAVNDAMNDAMDAGADIISMSFGYGAGVFIDDAFPRAIREGVVIVGSVANTDDLILTINFPAGANGSVGVQAANQDGVIQDTDGRPNSNHQTKVIGPGAGILGQGFRQDDNPGVTPTWEKQILIDGTSEAAPIVAGFMGLGMQKWPNATGNQMIQSLIHTTGGVAGEAVLDPANLIGYGFASATGMIATDPTQYPDENPLVTEQGAPDASVIFGTPTASPSPTDAPDAEGAPIDIGIILIVLVGILIVVGAVVLVVVLAVRRSQRTQPRI